MSRFQPFKDKLNKRKQVFKQSAKNFLNKPANLSPRAKKALTNTGFAANQILTSAPAGSFFKKKLNIDLPDKAANTVGSVVGNLAPFVIPAGAGSKAVRSIRGVRSAQKSAGKLAARLISKGGIRKVGGKAVANVSKGLPSAVAVSGTRSVAKTVDPEQSLKGTGKEFAGDIAFDALTAGVPVVGLAGTVVGNKGAREGIKDAILKRFRSETGDISAESLSRFAKNSFVNNPEDALLKRNRLKGEGLSFEEARTGIASNGKNLKDRIVFSKNDKGEVVLEDGRHLLEAYRQLGVPVPKDKIKFEFKSVKDAAEKPRESITTILPDGRNATERFGNMLGELDKFTQQRKRSVKKLRISQADRLNKAFEDSQGNDVFQAVDDARRGVADKVQFTPLRTLLSSDDIKELTDTISKKDMDVFSKGRAVDATRKLLDGELPVPSEIKSLAEVFGSDFVEPLIEKKPALRKVLDFMGTNLLEVTNASKSIKSSVDLSGLRQGIAFIGRPKDLVPAFKQMFSLAASETRYQDFLKKVESSPLFPLMEDAKLAITKAGGEITEREEAFISQLPAKIPGIGPLITASERGYSGFLTALRVNAFETEIQRAVKNGVDIDDPKFYRALGRYINTMTGRGEFTNKTIDAAMPLLNNFFYSPRMIKGRLDALGLGALAGDPGYYASLPPSLRKVAARDMASFLATGASLAGLATLAGGVVETDPRSSDFGKIRFGKTRYDIWGGFTQYVTLMARMASGQTKSAATGKIRNLGKGKFATNRAKLLGDFATNKAAPVVGKGLDVLRGENFRRQEFEPTAEFNLFDPDSETFTITDSIADLFIPFMAMDLTEAIKEDRSQGLLKVLPSFFGIGTNTFDAPDTNGTKLVKPNLTGKTTNTVPTRKTLKKKEPKFISPAN